MRRSCTVLVLLCIAREPASAQNKTASESQVKAVFLYNFTQFVEWPPSTFESAGSPFVIGIAGEDQFGGYLEETVAGEKLGSHPIVIRRIITPKDIAGCQMVYISLTDGTEVRRMLTETAGKSILTVGDSPGFIKWGGIVRFFTENSKIRLEINAELSKASQLHISAKLLNLAKTD